MIEVDQDKSSDNYLQVKVQYEGKNYLVVIDAEAAYKLAGVRLYRDRRQMASISLV